VHSGIHNIKHGYDREPGRPAANCRPLLLLLLLLLLRPAAGARCTGARLVAGDSAHVPWQPLQGRMRSTSKMWELITVLHLAALALMPCCVQERAHQHEPPPARCREAARNVPHDTVCKGRPTGVHVSCRTRARARTGNRSKSVGHGGTPCSLGLVWGVQGRQEGPRHWAASFPAEECSLEPAWPLQEARVAGAKARECGCCVKRQPCRKHALLTSRAGAPGAWGSGADECPMHPPSDARELKTNRPHSLCWRLLLGLQQACSAHNSRRAPRLMGGLLAGGACMRQPRAPRQRAPPGGRLRSPGARLHPRGDILQHSQQLLA
jgi:hypothetical protein